MKIFDTHCDTLDLLTENNSLYDCDTHYNFNKASVYSTHIQVTAIWIDGANHNPYERTSRLIGRFYKETKDISVIKTKRDLLSASGIGVILGIEGGEPVGADLQNVQLLFDKGVRVLTLVWNNDNAIGGCAMNGKKGLTDFGRKAVRKMESLGITVDVSHLSEQGFYDVFETAQKPFIASHSNSSAICPHFRNLTNDQFKCLIKAGGATGINLCPDFLGENASIDTIIAHIEHFMALGGEDNIGIGADFDGIDSLPQGICGTQDLYKIADRLLQLNYTENQVLKIAYENMARVFSETLPE